MQHSIRGPNFPLGHSHTKADLRSPGGGLPSSSNPAPVVAQRRTKGNRKSSTENSTESVAQSSASDHEPNSKTLSLDSIQQILQEVIHSPNSFQEIAKRFVEINCHLTNAIWTGHFSLRDGQIHCTAEYNPIAQQNLGLLTSSLLPAVESAIKESKSRIINDGQLTVISTPIFADQNAPLQASECFCVALNLHDGSAEPFLLITQMIATALGQWHQRHGIRRLDWQIDATAAIADLVSKIINTDGSTTAATVATNELSRFLNAPVVAIGYCQNANSKRTRIQSISGTTEIDRGGRQAQLIQTALNETLIRGSVSSLPAIEGDDRTMKIAHAKLLETYPGQRLVSSPLTTADGKTIGAWICVLPNNESQHEQLTRFAMTTSSYLADALDANNRASSGALSRLKSQTKKFCQGKMAKILLAGFSALTLLMLIPIPHRIACDCQLQPTVRRFAVAPHDGILLESFVKPGDMIAAGQVLAQMDDRELRLQLSDLIAQSETAMKKRDVNRSARDAAGTQIAELEMDQLNAQIELIKFKMNNLQIKAAVAGIVLQGDLEDARGAPVRTGDVLIEIAPLEKLKLELAVHEPNIPYVQPTQSATIVLDGAPFETIKANVERISPISEVRKNKNVFVAELIINNDQGLLRPGMHGRAKINAGNQPLGWVLFHHPAERVFSIFR